MRRLGVDGIPHLRADSDSEVTACRLCALTSRTVATEINDMSRAEWKDDWICSEPFFVPSHIALARWFEGGEIKALIELRGTRQRSSYTLRRFHQGVRSKAIGPFPSLSAAKAVAVCSSPGSSGRS